MDISFKNVLQPIIKHVSRGIVCNVEAIIEKDKKLPNLFLPDIFYLCSKHAAIRIIILLACHTFDFMEFEVPIWLTNAQSQ